MNRHLVVVGASLGGVSALPQIAAALRRPFPAALLVVQHMGTYASDMAAIIGRASDLPADFARQGEAIEPGRIYVAPPDHHMLVEGQHLVLTRGPKEHHTRPAIDPLFRSAALQHGPAVIGVVLSGLLDDGTHGLQIVKACGGLAIVQDPQDAVRPEMPSSALRHVEEVDHCVPLAEIAELLDVLVREPLHHHPAGHRRGRPPEVALQENAMTAQGAGDADRLDHIGAPSGFVCPDCHGALWEIGGSEPPRYRCHTGHAFSLRSLQATLEHATEQALWSAIRSLQEQAMVEERLVADEAGAATAARRERVRALREKAALLRRLAEEEPAGP